MNISWYYIALGPNSIILIYCFIVITHAAHVAGESKKQGREQSQTVFVSRPKVLQQAK
jgi:hypothetical protein